VLAVLGGLAGLAVVLCVAGYLVAGDTLPRDAVVSGVPVGGLTPAQAQDTLEAELGPRAAAAVPVTAGSRTARVSPADAGLAVDYAASIRAAGGGRSLDPRQIVRVLTGGASTEAVVVSDPNRLSAAVQRLATEVDTAPKDAGLAFRDGGYTVTEARAGVRLRQQDTAAALVAGFPGGGSPVALPVDQADPGVTTEEAEQVRTGYAQPAVAAPVRVTAGGAGSFGLTPAMIASGLRFPVRDGALTPELDAPALRRAAAAEVRTVELRKPRDATVRLVDGRPKVIPAVDGTTVGAQALAEAVEPVLTRAGDERRASIRLDGAEAEVSTADAEKLGVREVTGEFTTSFPYAEYRNVNIGRAAELINGTLLEPGETFSLNRVVGERTKANGFTEGFIISGGKFKRELGGGVSQSATTAFNAMFFAGLKDVEHQPHTLYIDRYPPGREATVAWPDLDLRFANDTDYGVLVQASVVRATTSRQGSITVRMWSTKTWDKVTSTTPATSNFTSGRDLVDTSASCEPQEPAQGFDVSYARLFERDGTVVRRQNFSWRYGPTDRIRCG
jgi:vancomycin resistance protein YoaR